MRRGVHEEREFRGSGSGGFFGEVFRGKRVQVSE